MEPSTSRELSSQLDEKIEAAENCPSLILRHDAPLVHHWISGTFILRLRLGVGCMTCTRLMPGMDSWRFLHAFLAFLMSSNWWASSWRTWGTRLKPHPLEQDPGLGLPLWLCRCGVIPPHRGYERPVSSYWNHRSCYLKMDCRSKFMLNHVT